MELFDTDNTNYSLNLPEITIPENNNFIESQIESIAASNPLSQAIESQGIYNSLIFSVFY